MTQTHEYVPRDTAAGHRATAVLALRGESATAVLDDWGRPAVRVPRELAQQLRIGPLHGSEQLSQSSLYSSSSSSSSGASVAPPAATMQRVVGSGDPVPVRTGDGVFIANSTITFLGGRSIGLGLFAGRRFAAGDYITWYYGRREPDTAGPGDTSEHKLSLGYARNDIGEVLPYVIDGTRMPDGTQITNPAVQLAILQEGGAAWANDVNFRAPPGAMQSVLPLGAATNSEFVFIESPDGNPRNAAVYLRALRDIAPYDEIFVDYGARFRTPPAQTATSAAAAGGGGSARKRRGGAPRKLMNPDAVTAAENEPPMW